MDSYASFDSIFLLAYDVRRCSSKLGYFFIFSFVLVSNICKIESLNKRQSQTDFNYLVDGTDQRSKKGQFNDLIPWE